MYALVIDNTIEQSGRLPDSARRLDTQEWVLGLPDAPADLVEATGWYQVVEPAQPAPSSPDVVQESTIEIVNGVPTRVWTERARTPEEQAAADADANRLTIEQQAETARATNTTYVNRATPTAAQTTAQVRALSQQSNALIRLLLNQLDSTD